MDLLYKVYKLEKTTGNGMLSFHQWLSIKNQLYGGAHHLSVTTHMTTFS